MTIGVKIENIQEVLIYLMKNHNYKKIMIDIKKENQILMNYFVEYLKEKGILVEDKILKKINGYLFLINYNTNIIYNLLKSGNYNFGDRKKYPLLVRHELSTICEYMNKTYSVYINYFNNYIDELNDEKIKDSLLGKIYKKYLLINEYLEIYKNKNEKYPSTTCDKIDKILNSANIIKHLFIINKNYKEGKKYNNGHSLHNLVGPILNCDFPIKDGIILVEDRFLIKDLTKIYDMQKKLTLTEIKKTISSQ